MNQSDAIDYLWERKYFEEKRQPREIAGEIWTQFKISCSNITMILKGKKYLTNKKGWKQRYGSENNKSVNSPSDGIRIVYIEAGKPITALEDVGKILEKIEGEVLICDNYFGIKSMINLYKLKKASKIKFICGNLKEDEKIIKNLINDYNKENNGLEVRIFNKAELHDRYMLTKKDFVILGHGFADLGNKESLVIVIPKDLVKDICEDLTSRFNQKWNGSKKI